MVDIAESFEEKDVSGSTVHYNGTATTTPANIPISDNKVVSEVIIRNTGAVLTTFLQVSFDNGTNYFDVLSKEVITWSPKGSQKHFVVRTNVLTTTYQAIVNYEAF